MRIAYLSESSFPSPKANSIQVIRMCEAFSGLGHDVVLFATRGGAVDFSDLRFQYDIREEFRIVLLKRGWHRLSSQSYGYRVSRLVAELNIDLLYGRCPHSLLWCMRLGIPYVLETHSPPRSALRMAIECAILSGRNLASLVVISGSLGFEYQKRFRFLASKRVIVAHDGANLPGGSPDDASQLNSFPASMQRPRVAYVGSLYPGKGMEIVSELARLTDQFEFHVVGSNGPLAEWQSDFGDRIKFHGQVDTWQVPSLLGSFDILLLPPQARSEAANGEDIAAYMSPLKMFEYMAAGKPIVASDLPVIREVLKHEETALLVDPSDIAGWLYALGRLAGDRSLGLGLGRRARLEILEKYTWSKRAQTVLEGVTV